MRLLLHSLQSFRWEAGREYVKHTFQTTYIFSTRVSTQRLNIDNPPPHSLSPWSGVCVARGGKRGGENVYLNPYSHIDQVSVEVRLARDNNDPDLATRHVSVLLSFLLSIRQGSWVLLGFTPRASSPRHTAVTRHKEGSISTALSRLHHPPSPPSSAPALHLHAPSKSSATEWETGDRTHASGDQRCVIRTGRAICQCCNLPTGGHLQNCNQNPHLAQVAYFLLTQEK